MQKWPEYWPVNIGLSDAVGLPLVVSESGFGIYALDMMGQTIWNKCAAQALYEKLADFDFDIILTAEAKAIGLAEELSGLCEHTEYVVLRKSAKLYMPNPVSVEVQSITTTEKQHFYLGQDKLALLKNRRALIVDDVLSTGGTLKAMLEIARQASCQIVAIAVVLTEEVAWQSFEDIPVISLDHIPLPAYAQYADASTE